MARITFIGAGSTVFARNLLGDILSREELAGSEIVLFDIDAERLATSELVARKVAEAVDAPAKISASTDRRAALDGADYAINMIQVGGYEPCTVTDFEVPKRFGLRQTIADTLGIGGIMRGLRTIPVLLSMCADMEELCPDVWFLNYTNPMAINCRAVARARARSARSGCVTACRALRSSSRPISGFRIATSTTSRPASTTWRSTSGSSATAKISTRSYARSQIPVRCPSTIACATRCCGTSATSSLSRVSTSPSTCPGSSSATGPT